MKEELKLYSCAADTVERSQRQQLIGHTPSMRRLQDPQEIQFLILSVKMERTSS